MHLQRYGFIFLTFYMIFFGGGGYFQLPLVRYFHHIFMTVLIVGWLIWRLRKGRGLPESPLNYPLYALVLTWFITTPFALDPRIALENLWFPLLNLMMFWFIVNAFQRAQQRLIMDTLFLATVILIFLAAMQVFSVFFGWGIGRPAGDAWVNYLAQGIPLPWNRDMRIWLPLGVSTWVSGVVAPLITLVITWAISTQRQIHQRLFWILAILLGIVLILTFSRGGLVSVMAALGFLVLLRVSQNQRLRNIFTRRNLAVLGGLAVLLAVIGFVVLTLGRQAGHQSGDQVRLDLWQSASEIIQDSPLTGVGIGQYGRALRTYRSLEVARDRLSTAHNIYLNSAAESGLVTIFIAIWAAIMIIRAWWQQHQSSEINSMRRFRLEGMLAVLLGIALHNMVDTLTITASLALLTVIVVYCTVEPARSRLDTPPRGHRWAAIIALFIFSAYGIWFVAVLDRAQQHYQNSIQPGDNALEEAQQAEAIDPFLNLYDMQITHLLGQTAFDNPTDEPLATAITSYQTTLELEPTWDTAWLNLAALYELQGNFDAALEAYTRAQSISPFTSANIHWARLSEAIGQADADAIIAAYQAGIGTDGYLPLSPFWYETDLRRQALERYANRLPLDLAYRIWAVHEPERLPELLPENPQTAAEWWIVGEYALRIENNPPKAQESFTQAIQISPANGDYYASRARAALEIDPESALHDLDIARFLGTRNEYPNAIEIQLSSDPEEIKHLRIFALPPRVQSQNFEGVLFGGRSGYFTLLPTVRYPGPGKDAMQPWYDLAASYENTGDIEQAIIVYEAILDYAPDESRADEALQ
jgi:tetratricopeptide (TPR) repeat protein